MHNFLVLQGPNLNRLGQRSPELYGTATLADVDADLQREADRLGCSVEQFQSNSEGILIDWLYANVGGAAGVLCNPAGLTNYGLSLRDALAECGVPVAIVHLSNVHARETWRRNDVFAEIASIYVAGMGWIGYRHALGAMHERLVAPAHATVPVS